MKLFSKSRNRFDGVADGRTFDRMKETIIQSNPPPSSTPLKPRRRWSSPVNEGREELPLTERKRALFEPLDPIRRHDNNNLLPPPDFDAATYPSGWVVGKKRKLVNVDVVESMRRIAVHEMNRKDQEIDGLNEQLEEDARCLERLQLQLQQERSKRMELERENTVLQDRIGMLSEMLEENEDAETVDGAAFSPSNL
jgi:hypothetical protein